MAAAAAAAVAPHPLRRVVHIRYVAAPYGAQKPMSFIVVSPDQDEYEEDYSDGGDYAEVVVAADWLTVPGVPAAESLALQIVPCGMPLRWPFSAELCPG